MNRKREERKLHDNRINKRIQGIKTETVRHVSEKKQLDKKNDSKKRGIR